MFILDNRVEIVDFYCVYLLLSKQNNMSVYVGSTPNPIRRLRQHNAQIKGGAKKTSKKRPWMMQCFVHGFMTKYDALVFEWAFQHPSTTRFLADSRQAGTIVGGVRGMKSAVTVLLELLNCKRWSRHGLSLHVCDGHVWSYIVKADSKLRTSLSTTFSPSIFGNQADDESDLLLTSDNIVSDAGDMKLTPLAEFSKDDETVIKQLMNARSSTGRPRRKDKVDCSICFETIHSRDAKAALDHSIGVRCIHAGCNAIYHLKCLSEWYLFRDRNSIIPSSGTCPYCRESMQWKDVISFNLK